jgi:hypothetical protein
MVKLFFAVGPLWMMAMNGRALAITVAEPIEPPTIGEMEVKHASGADRRQALDLARLDVRVSVHGDVALTEVEHDFYNDSDERLEGTFRFPLPPAADITGLAMEVDGRMVEGELIERQRAERIYDQIVDEMRDPALLTWDSGNLFKLRVFPIEPNAHKRVVMRYLVPLKIDGHKAQYSFQAQAAQLATHVGQFHFVVDGRTIYDESRFQPRAIVVDVPRDEPFRRALAETVGGATYLRIKAPIAQAGARHERSSFRWVVVVDVSRSALEARPLVLDTVRAALSSLPAGDQFSLLACDIACRESAPDGSFAAPTPAAIAQALHFLESIEFDGATDLGAAFKLAATRARDSGGQILYIGDGNPTWGTTDPAELSQALAPSLARVPLHAVVLGKYARPALLSSLQSKSGGLLFTPARKDELQPLGRALADFGRVPRLSDITITASNGAVVTPSRPAPIDAGDELSFFVRSDKDHAPPASVHVTARLDGKMIEKELPLSGAAQSRFVARRFAGSRVRELELEGGHDDEVLALSLEHKVLSSKTAWLVLENDEAYRKHEIARRESATRGDPTVSGKDLESTGERAAESVGGEGPEPELWLLASLALVAFAVRRRARVAR